MDKNIIELAKEKLSTLTPTHTFKFAIIVASMLFVISILSFMRATKQANTIDDIKYLSTEQINLMKGVNESLIRLIDNLELQNKNNLTYEEASYIYLKTFQTSKYKIIEKMMLTLERNNVDDSIRQEVIYKTYRVFISNLYIDDYTKLSKFKYNNTQLSDYMDNIDNKVVCDELTNILFQENIDHNIKREDALNYLEYTFRQFYQNASENLKNYKKL